MKNCITYVFKSQRLTQAKLKLRKESLREKQVQKRTRRITKKSDCPKTNQTFLLKAIRDPSRQSVLQIKLVEKGDSSSKTRSTKTEEDTHKQNAHKKDFVSHMNTLNVKSPTKDNQDEVDHIEIVEDGSPFSEKEVQFFEQKYEAVLFDNTITVSENRQADLGKLSQRSFNSYRRRDKKVEMNKTSFEFKQKVSCVVNALGYTRKKDYSNSQIHALSNVCESMKCLKSILDSDPKLVQSYFESTQGFK